MKGLKKIFEAMPTSAPLPSPPPQVIQSSFSPMQWKRFLPSATI